MDVEVRSVGDDGLDEIFPLLSLFNSPRMTREDWQRMLFRCSWPGAGPVRGYALYAGGKAVGFYATLFSTRPFRGSTERFCNPACWAVLEEYRAASLLLLKPVLALRDCTVVHLTPSPTAYQVYARLGCKPLESEVLFLPPLPGPAQAVRGLKGSFTSDPAVLERELKGEELQYFRDLRTAPMASHVLLQRGGRQCYVVATPTRRKGVQIAAVRYLGDRAFFWEHRILAHVALAKAMGTVVLEVDARFAERRRVPFALRHPARRSYAPARPDITPDAVDGLYSEWMGLRE